MNKQEASAFRIRTNATVSLMLRNDPAYQAKLAARAEEREARLRMRYEQRRAQIRSDISRHKSETANKPIK